MTDLATRLETEGITPSVARSEYGFADSWEMAEAWFPKLAALQPAPQRPKIRRRRWPDYLKGISFALPLFLSCVAMLGLNFSLWGGNLSIENATAVGAGTIASFIATGGFIQAMARRGLFYIGTDQYARCRRSTVFWVRCSIYVNVVSALVFFLANWYFGWLPDPLAALAVCFYLCLGLYWIATGILYMLERNLLVSFAFAVGIAGVALLHLKFAVPLLAAQLISILAASCVSFVAAAVILQRKSAWKKLPPEARLFDRRSYLFWPYFAYGALYYFFLFSDRMLSWTAHTSSASLVVTFRGDYELAGVLGLFAFIFQVGWVHLATLHFYRTVRVEQARSHVSETARFNSALTRFYGRQIAFFLPCAALLSGAIFFSAASLDLFRNSIMRFVAGWGLAGYPFVVVGLWNVSLLFALSRGRYALKAVALASATNVAAGYLASRVGGYHLAIVGFTLGALVFAAITSRYSLATFRRLDYYYLASAA